MIRQFTYDAADHERLDKFLSESEPHESIQIPARTLRNLISFAAEMRFRIQIAVDEREAQVEESGVDMPFAPGQATLPYLEGALGAMAQAIYQAEYHRQAQETEWAEAQFEEAHQ